MKKLSLVLIALLLCCVMIPVCAANTDEPLYGDAYVAANETALLSFVKENVSEDAAEHSKLKLTRSVALPDITEPADVDYLLSYDADSDHVLFWYIPHDWEKVVFSMELLPNGKATFYHTVVGNSIVTKSRADVNTTDVLMFNHNGAPKVTIPWSMEETETLVGWDALLDQCLGLHLYDLGFYGLCPNHKLFAVIGNSDVQRCGCCHMETRTTLWGDDYYQSNEKSLIALLNNIIREGEAFPAQLLKTQTLTCAQYDLTYEATCALLLNDRGDGVVFRMTNSVNSSVCELLLTPDLKAELWFRDLPDDGSGKTTCQLLKTREAFPRPDMISLVDNSVRFKLYCTVYCLSDVIEIWTNLLKDACGMELYQLGFTCFCRTHKLELYQADDPVCDGVWTEYFRCKTCRKCSETAHKGEHVFGDPVITKPVGCFEDGEKTLTCTRCGYKSVYAIPSPNEHTWWETTQAATAKRDGYTREECERCGAITNNTEIPKIASVTLSTAEYTCNGKARTPKVIVKDRTGKEITRGNYKVTYPKGRKQPGVYTVTIKMIGESYRGTFTRKFKILPAKATGLTVSGKQLKWKAVSSAQKYIVYYRLGKTGEFKKLCSTAKTACSLQKLQSGKLYYFKVRTYYRDAASKTTLLGNSSAAVKARL